MPTDLKF